MPKSPEGFFTTEGREGIRNKINEALDHEDYNVAKNLIEELRLHSIGNQKKESTEAPEVEVQEGEGVIDEIFSALENFYHGGNYGDLKSILDQSGLLYGEAELDSAGLIFSTKFPTPGSDLNCLLAVEHPKGSEKFKVFPPKPIPCPTAFQRYFRGGNRKSASFERESNGSLILMEHGGDGGPKTQWQ